jgi:cyanophycinase-like exopeptidase
VLSGWLALLGGGEFSFGQTALADRAWLAKVPEGPIAFLPTASGSQDYARHFATYMQAVFHREVVLVPVYRLRDARRARNAERIFACAAAYLGGGVADQLLEVLRGTPVADALRGLLEQGKGVVAIGSSAQACGTVCRSFKRGQTLSGLGLFQGVLEPVFDPAHDRRLRSLLKTALAPIGWGVPEGGALLFGPAGAIETVGPVFRLSDPDGDLEVLETDLPSTEPANRRS